MNVSIATGRGSSIFPVKQQLTLGKVVGTTHLDQSRHAFRCLRTALEPAGAVADVAKFNIYVVDYSWDALEAVMAAAKEIFGEPYPLTANTLVGVASLWLPDLLVEVDAVAIL